MKLDTTLKTEAVKYNNGNCGRKFTLNDDTFEIIYHVEDIRDIHDMFNFRGFKKGQMVGIGTRINNSKEYIITNDIFNEKDNELICSTFFSELKKKMRSEKLIGFYFLCHNGDGLPLENELTVLYDLIIEHFNDYYIIDGLNDDGKVIGYLLIKKK
jgi:hypothetical protein